MVYTEYSGNPKVRFLLVDSELNGDTPDEIARFIQARAVTIPVALDPQQSFVKLNGFQIPLLIVVDQHTHIRFEETGYTSGEQTERELNYDIDTLLAAN